MLPKFVFVIILAFIIAECNAFPRTFEFTLTSGESPVEKEEDATSFTKIEPRAVSNSKTTENHRGSIHHSIDKTIVDHTSHHSEMMHPKKWTASDKKDQQIVLKPGCCG